MPHCPRGANLRWLASTAAVGLMKASCKSLVSDAGSGLPSHFSSSGFGSNKSSWLGPPSMNRKITFLAFGANIGALGASGFVSTVAPYPSLSSRFASAIVPIPPAQLRKKSRLVGFCETARDPYSLFPVDEFVQIEQNAADAGPVLLLMKISG